MSTLGASPREKLISRIGFYTVVLLVMWTANFLKPDFEEIREEKLRAHGVATPYFGVAFDPRKASTAK